jgi:hypothetical protein
VRGLRTAILAISACAALAACGSSSDDDTRPATNPTGLGDTRELTATYAFPTQRHVRTTVATAGVVDPASNVLVPAPAGTRPVEVVFRWRDRGADPLPWRDLRFTALTSDGDRVRELYRVPVARKQLGGDDGPAREARVGFAVPSGAGLARVDLGSIIAGAPLRATWKLPSR